MWKRVSTAIVVARSVAAGDPRRRLHRHRRGPQPATAAGDVAAGDPADPGHCADDAGRNTARDDHLPGRHGPVVRADRRSAAGAKRWSFSVYRVNFDYNEGFTDVSNWPVTFGVGLGDRAELFGAWDVVRRIDRDARPIFFTIAAAAASPTNIRSCGRAGRATSSATSGSAASST